MLDPFSTTTPARVARQATASRKEGTTTAMVRAMGHC